MIGEILKAVVSPVAGVFNKRTDRKIQKDAIKGKQQLAKQQDATQITLTDAEWETVGQSLQDTTWKDEYVTILITSPLALILAGGVIQGFTGDSRLLNGVTTGLHALSTMGVDMGTLMTAVVFAAIGLKLWRA